MNTPDIGTQIYRAIAYGMLADPSWSVTSDNFGRYDEIDGIQSPGKYAEADGDYPQALLTGPVSGKTDLYTGTETFATYAASPEGPHDWLEKGEWVFRLVITSDLFRIQNYSPQTLESVNAIRRLGPRLGLPYVTGVKIVWDEKETENADPNQPTQGTRRIVSTIVITVNTEIDGQSLTGQ